MATQDGKQPPLAIGSRLKGFAGIVTLGLLPNYCDYSPRARQMMDRARTIYYPTNAYALDFHARGKKIFPSLSTHFYESDKIRQSNLFNALGLPHPATRVFYGRQTAQITEHFSFPFVAKKARAAARGKGVFLIENQEQLAAYLAAHHPAYIQEYLPIEREVRVVVIGRDPAVAYGRRPAVGDFRANLALGGSLDLGPQPAGAVELAVEAARLAGLDDVGLDVALVDGKPLLLEFNVKYGREGAAALGIDLRRVVAEKVLAGEV